MPTIVPLSQTKTESVKWLWPRRIPLGEITIMEGDPGTNKSSVTYDLSARLSRGDSMPCANGKTEAGGTVLLVGEDSVAKTVKPRLMAAKADVDKIVTIANLDIPDELPFLRGAIEQISAKLVVVDTLNDFLVCSGLVNKAVRDALRPLRELAEEMDVAVVVIRHFTKSGNNALLQGGGSGAITAVARSQIKILQHPDDPDLRILYQDKCSFGPLPAALAFEVVPTDGQFHLDWHGEVDFQLDKRPQPKVEAAEQMLLALLTKGPVEVNKILEKTRGKCSKRTLDTAKRNLGVRTLRNGNGKEHRVSWELLSAN